MKTFVIILLFGCMVEKARAQELLTQKVKALKGLDINMHAPETNFNFRMASAIHNNRVRERHIVKSLKLSASEVKSLNIYLDYLTFHAPCYGYGNPLLLNPQLNNFVIGPLQSTQ
jgi:hypothetical protein